MRVVACLLAEQIGDVEDLAVAARVGVEQLLAPVVVAGAVEDHKVSFGEGACVVGVALVLMGVGVRVGDDGLDINLGAAKLRRDAAPEVLAGDHVERARVGGRVVAASGACADES